MQRSARRRAASFIVLPLAALLLSASVLAQSAPATQDEAKPVATTASDEPVKVMVGAYINDIQLLDFKTNNYAVDLYVWFRWKAPDLDPSKTMEFMNRYASDDNQRDELYAKPEAMPDGSLYAIIRYQGRFSTNFALENYPFDTQELTVVMEDTISGADKEVYVPDGANAVTLDPKITLPGFRVGKPTIMVSENTYPTNFGDISEPSGDTYSRLTLSIPVTRPVVAMSIKTFIPIVLIVVWASLGASSDAQEASSASGNSDKRDFESAKELGTAEAWQAFLAAHPSGFYSDLARAYLAKLSAGGAASRSPLICGFVIRQHPRPVLLRCEEPQDHELNGSDQAHRRQQIGGR
jgi:hypothetical protein